MDLDLALHPGFVWICGACGEAVIRVFLLEVGDPDPRTRLRLPGAPADGRDPLDRWPRLAIQGGPVSMTIDVDAESVPSVWEAVRSGDVRSLFAINREYAPFWCPDCSECYCAKHYEHWDVYADDYPGWFESARGRCPRGHERELVD